MNKRLESQPFRLDEKGLCTQLTSFVGPRMRDLLRVAMRIYVADRLTKRKGRADLDGPSRVLQPLVIRVSEPDFWNSTTVNELVRRAINFVTDDDWDIRFEPNDPVPRQQLLPSFPPTDDMLVCLYSGGLDSTAGLANRLQDWHGRVLAVTAQHQAGQSKLIREKQLPRLRERFGNRVSSVIVRTTLRNPPPMNCQELTQRSRSFLFAALGGAVARECGVESVEVYENGVGVINLPLMTGMLVGGRATRSAHPEFFRRMSNLVSEVADRPINFVLPFRNKTKAQMVKTLADDDILAAVARSSVSCVHYPRRVEGTRKQCGVCPGCIGRRQALISAGICERSDKYAFDIFGSEAEVAAIPSSKLNFLKATVTQVESLSCVSADAPLPLAVHTHLASVLESTEGRYPSIRVLQKYRKEWLPLIEESLRAGRHWARWHGPIPSSSARSVA